LGPDDQAGVDENALAAGHEGIQAAVLHKHDRDAFGIESRHAPDRCDERPDGVLNLGVAYQIEPLTLLGVRGTKRPERQRGQAEEGEDASGQRVHGTGAG